MHLVYLVSIWISSFPSRYGAPIDGKSIFALFQGIIGMEQIDRPNAYRSCFIMIQQIFLLNFGGLFLSRFRFCVILYIRMTILVTVIAFLLTIFAMLAMLLQFWHVHVVDWNSIRLFSTWVPVHYRTKYARICYNDDDMMDTGGSMCK